jgi:hypothetical protein
MDRPGEFADGKYPLETADYLLARDSFRREFCKQGCAVSTPPEPGTGSEGKSTVWCAVGRTRSG